MAALPRASFNHYAIGPLSFWAVFEQSFCRGTTQPPSPSANIRCARVVRVGNVQVTLSEKEHIACNTSLKSPLSAHCANTVNRMISGSSEHSGSAQRTAQSIYASASLLNITTATQLNAKFNRTTTSKVHQNQDSSQINIPFQQQQLKTSTMSDRKSLCTRVHTFDGKL